MKIGHFFAASALLGTLVSCQSPQEVGQTPEPVTSSITKENGGARVSATPETAGARVAAATTTQQQEVLTYINQARSQTCLCGTTVYPAVAPLTLNARLNAAADKFAVDMATYNYFSHQGRDGSWPWDRMTREGYAWKTAGEDIAAGLANARGAVNAWLKSPGHCAILMSANYKDLGVGYGYSSASTYKAYWVANFGKQ